jgi:hypothetical protein
MIMSKKIAVLVTNDLAGHKQTAGRHTGICARILKNNRVTIRQKGLLLPNAEE